MPTSRRRPKRLRARPNRPLSYTQILAWADEHFERTGHWPNTKAGAIPGTACEKWRNIDGSLRTGSRELPRGSSLARLLAERRGVRNIAAAPPLTVTQILAWADSHFLRTGRWPNADSGPISEMAGENWGSIDAALRVGIRGLPPASSLARLFAQWRGLRNSHALPPLTVKQVLAWADTHYAHTGAWPKRDSGLINASPGDSWLTLSEALRNGRRGLPRTTLAKLFARERGVTNRAELPRFSESQILDWADAHHSRLGMWPTADSGRIFEAPRDSWRAVDKALRRGSRGLPGGSSLPRLLRRRRGVRTHVRKPPLVIGSILAWADAHYHRRGCWPNLTSGAIAEAPGETWGKIELALRQGKRGLGPNDTLAKFLPGHRGLRNVHSLPRLTKKQILAWADAHHARHGRWPNAHSGRVDDTVGENWLALSAALRQGCRGLPGGQSLADLLAASRGVRHRLRQPRLTTGQILLWADAHYFCTGKWPQVRSGAVEGAKAETWLAINTALDHGARGLPGGSSLAKLLAQHRGVRNSRCLPKLTVAQILAWADAHHARTGLWPARTSGAIKGLAGESWSRIDKALRRGTRGLRVRSSIFQIMKKHRGVSVISYKPEKRV